MSVANSNVTQAGTFKMVAYIRANGKPWSPVKGTSILSCGNVDQLAMGPASLVCPCCLQELELSPVHNGSELHIFGLQGRTLGKRLSGLHNGKPTLIAAAVDGVRGAESSTKDDYKTTTARSQCLL
jgi:hypothetical protein